MRVLGPGVRGVAATSQLDIKSKATFHFLRHQSSLFVFVFSNFIYAIQMPIQNPAKHLRWSFL